MEISAFPGSNTWIVDVFVYSFIQVDHIHYFNSVTACKWVSPESLHLVQWFPLYFTQKHRTASCSCLLGKPTGASNSLFPVSVLCCWNHLT